MHPFSPAGRDATMSRRVRRQARLVGRSGAAFILGLASAMASGGGWAEADVLFTNSDNIAIPTAARA